MRQKFIWMLLLTIGTASSFYSCHTIVDPRLVEEFYVQNNTGDTVVFKPFLQVAGQYEPSFKAGKAIVLPPAGTWKEVHEEGNSNETLVAADSLVVCFGSRRYAAFSHENVSSPFNLLNPANYRMEEKSQYHRLFFYTLDKKDVDEAMAL